ncbi:hypothetical protein FDF84_12275, partial [Clostridium botulinum]|nr:hypothetical protein [Clostridium botulinum]
KTIFFRHLSTAYSLYQFHFSLSTTFLNFFNFLKLLKLFRCFLCLRRLRDDKEYLIRIFLICFF